MIPLLQKCHYYINTVRCSEKTFMEPRFRSLLNDQRQESYLQAYRPCPPFTDCTKTEANRLMAMSPWRGYFNVALMTYLCGIEATEHTDIASLFPGYRQCAVLCSKEKNRF